MREARKTGYPYLVVAGKGVLEETPLLELHCLFSGDVRKLTPEQVRILKHRCRNIYQQYISQYFFKVVDHLAGVKMKLKHAEL